MAAGGSPQGVAPWEEPSQLAVRRLSKAFGGLLALRDVSLDVWPGQIKGLIGPNGAGKTTLFNLITGALASASGDIRFCGHSLVGQPPYLVAALGIARTFQNVQIFPGMTVLENVLVGCHRHMHSGLLDATVRSRRMRQEEEAMRARAEALLETFGLAAWAGVPAESLPFGLQRLVEMGRALASGPRLLLLDEPGAGLSAAEKGDLAERIRRVRDGGTTVFLVEHDMELVMGLADEVAVLDHGVLIADGPPRAVQADPVVISAYLGEADPTDAA